MNSQAQTGQPHYPKIPWTPIIIMLVTLAVTVILGMGKWAWDDHISEFRQSRQETRAELKEITRIVTDIRIKIGK